MINFKPYLRLLVVFAGLMLTCCASQNDKEPAQETADSAGPADRITLTPAQVQAAGIRTGAPVRRTVGDQIQVAGLIDVPPQNLITIHVLLPGYVRQMDLLPGMQVHKGQTLALLDLPELLTLKQQYLAARARANQLEAEAERQSQLSTTEATSRKAADLALADYRQARSERDAAAARLARLNISPDQVYHRGDVSGMYQLTSPASGILHTVGINPGKYITPEEPLFQLQRPGHVHLELSVYERDAARLRLGQAVEYQLAGETASRQARIYLIGKDVRADRTVGVHCHLSQDDEKLLPGTSISARIHADTRTAQALPEDAFVSFQNRFYVFTQEDQSDARRGASYKLYPVLRGECEGGFCLADSLPRGIIVTQGAFTLLSALRNTADED